MKLCPNIKDDGHTPLLKASEKVFLNIVKYLIEDREMDPNYKDKYLRAPLFLASWQNQFNIIKYLIEEC